jgi:predicted metalloprotease with PDZ domain
MTHQYSISLSNHARNFLKIEARIPLNTGDTTLHIAAWRPGRYEEGNFAKNISSLKAFSPDHQKLTVRKTEKNTWEIDTIGHTYLIVEYLYYAKDLTAGNTYIDSQMMLLNPVNALIYNPTHFQTQANITFHLPSTWRLGGAEGIANNQYSCKDLETLFDTPFIASPTLLEGSYKVEDTQFHVLHNQQDLLDIEKVMVDFKKFTESQLFAFGDIPTKKYYFILLAVNLPYHHGVEHLNSTVIVLGPVSKWMTESYTELLSIASHELYHVWNVKTIRPAEMLPYRFQALNYAETGYIYEGITTFMGDYHLLRSKLVNAKKYLSILESQIQSHFDNPARFHTSVAEASVDTWVDGYVKGTPGRKVSIYNEGALLALVLDTKIRECTNNHFSLQTVMNRLYVDFGMQNIGYKEEDFLRILHETSGEPFDAFFKDYIHGNQGFESMLSNALAYYGIEMNTQENPAYSVSKLGLKTQQIRGKIVVQSIALGSPSEMGGLSENDVIIGINQKEIHGDIEEWVRFFASEEKNMLISRNGNLMNVILPEVQRTFNTNYKLMYSAEDLSPKIIRNRESFGWETAK